MNALTPIAGPQSLASTLDMRLGIVVVRVLCKAPDFQTALTAPSPDIGLAIPEWNPRTIERDTSGQFFVVGLNYEGHLNPENADGEDYGFEGVTAMDPIETSPNYETVMRVYNGTEDSQKRATFKRTLPVTGNGQPIRNPMHGVDSYNNPTIVWNHKWVTKNIPQSVVKNLGTIDRPTGGRGPQAVMPLNGNRNWLKVRGRGTFRGNIWQVEESWELSGPFGWVPELYRAPL